MSAASNYLETQIGTHLLLDDAWTKPTDIYVALFITNPGEDGTGGTEVPTANPSSSGYARIKHGPSDTTWTSTNGVFSNLGTVTFGVPTEDWGTITGWCLYDAVTSGNLLVIGTLSSNFSIINGDPALVFSEGALTVTIA